MEACGYIFPISEEREWHRHFVACSLYTVQLYLSRIFRLSLASWQNCEEQKGASHKNRLEDLFGTR